MKSGRGRALGIASSVFEPPQQMAHRHVDRFVELDVVELVELHGGLRAERRGAPRALDGRVGLVLVAVALDARVAVEGGAAE